MLAVTAEAGLPAAVAAAVVDYARRGLLPRNPGVLLVQLFRYLSLEGSVPLSRRQLLSALRAKPCLLTYSPDTLAWNHVVLESVFPEGAVPGMLMKAPSLWLLSPMGIWSRLDHLSLLLGVRIDDATGMAARQPRLLSTSVDALTQRHGSLAQALGSHGAKLSRVLVRQPGLLTFQPATLASNVAALRQLLGGITDAKLAALLYKQPSLVMLSAEGVRTRVERLGLLLGGLGPEQLATLVTRQPALLTLCPDYLDLKVSSLVEALGVDRQTLVAMAASCPSLLSLSPDTLAAKWRRLQAAAARAPAWRQQLAGMSRKSLAVWLCLSARRFSRLDYVLAQAADGAASSGGDGDVGSSPFVTLRTGYMSKWLLLPDAKFDALHPGFRTWVQTAQPQPGDDEAQQQALLAASND